MKKLVAVIIMLIFLLPAASFVDAGGKDKRYKKNSREYSRNYDNRHDWSHHHRHDWGKHRGWYKHHRHDRRDYHYKRHYRSRHDWNRHYRRNRDRYRHGGYHRDRDNRLMFSYCQEDSTRTSSKEVCFSFSIGD